MDVLSAGNIRGYMIHNAKSTMWM